MFLWRRASRSDSARDTSDVTTGTRGQLGGLVQYGESRQPVLGCRLDPATRRPGPHRAKRTRRLWQSNAQSIQCNNHRLAFWWDPLRCNRLNSTGGATPPLHLDRLWHRAGRADDHVRNPHGDLDPAVRVSRTVHLHRNVDVDERRESAELLSVTPSLLEHRAERRHTGEPREPHRLSIGAPRAPVIIELDTRSRRLAMSLSIRRFPPCTRHHNVELTVHDRSLNFFFDHQSAAPVRTGALDGALDQL
jgi:hypothetical protein